MNVPKITLTMLGASGSGKTLFLHGMYAMLSAGVAGYFMYTDDPDDDIDLMDAWSLLSEEGELPPANSVDGQKQYQFVFKYGLDPLFSVDCVDFRGGVTDAKLGDAADVEQIRKRLQVTDSIYLVLDGGRVAEWILKIKDLAEDEVVTWNRATDPMRIAKLTQFIDKAAEARRSRGKLAPSVVILITKSDLIPDITGMPKPKALGIAARRLSTLVPIAYAKGITALICPVQVGTFGTDLHKPVNPADLDPVGLHQPFVFSLWHYLTEVIQEDNEALRLLRERQADEYAQLNELRGRFGARFFHGDKIRGREEDIADNGRRIGDLGSRLSDSQSMVTQLMNQLGSLPIIKDGLLQV